jgi:nucleoside-diphosphate-sugar epimerase
MHGMDGRAHLWICQGEEPSHATSQPFRQMQPRHRRYRVCRELISAGHQVLGMARSDAGAKSLIAAGAEVHRGDLEDLESLRSGAAASDGVIHCAFLHERMFSNFEEVCEIDRRAITTLGSALIGSARPLVVTSGTAFAITPGRVTAEEDAPNTPAPRIASEQAARAVEAQGVRVSVVRLPQVHDHVRQGLITFLVALAREKGVSAYVGDGLNRWPAGHRLDAARLYRLALDKGSAGARYHAVAEEGVPLRKIAEAIGRGLKVPVVSKSAEEVGEHFGFLGMFAGLDMPASSALTQERLGWRPSGPGLISDLDRVQYFPA